MIEINWILFFTYLTSVIAIISTPGPNALLIVQHTIVHGRSAALFNALGSVFASFFIMTLSIFGLYAFFSEYALDILTFCGAIYLIYIGLKNINNNKFYINRNITSKDINHSRFFKEAFLVGISNPKDIIFFLVFMPQFIDKGINFFISSSILITTWMICDLSIMLFYGIFFSHIGKLYTDKLGLISKISGMIIVIIGCIVLINIVI